MEDASFTLEVRLLRTEVMDTLLCGHVAQNLGQGHFADLRTAHKNLLPMILASSADNAPTTTYRPPRPSTQCESVDTTTRKSHLFAEAVQRTTTERLTHRVMFGTMVGVRTTRDQADQKRLGPISSRRYQSIQSQRGVNGQPPFAVMSKECAVVESG